MTVTLLSDSSDDEDSDGEGIMLPPPATAAMPKPPAPAAPAPAMPKPAAPAAPAPGMASQAPAPLEVPEAAPAVAAPASPIQLLLCPDGHRLRQIAATAPDESLACHICGCALTAQRLRCEGCDFGVCLGCARDPPARWRRRWMPGCKCTQVPEAEGGAWGCLLPAGHDGPHSTALPRRALPASARSSLPAWLVVSARVEARFEANAAGRYYPGIVLEIDERSGISIEYDDGVREDDVDLSNVREPPPVPRWMRRGVRVEARYEGNPEGRFYPGTVSALDLSAHTCSIAYDDGDVEDHVMIGDVRKPTPLPSWLTRGARVEVDVNASDWPAGAAPLRRVGVIDEINAAARACAVVFDDGAREVDVPVDGLRRSAASRSPRPPPPSRLLTTASRPSKEPPRPVATAGVEAYSSDEDDEPLNARRAARTATAASARTIQECPRPGTHAHTRRASSPDSEEDDTMLSVRVGRHRTSVTAPAKRQRAPSPDDDDEDENPLRARIRKRAPSTALALKPAREDAATQPLATHTSDGLSQEAAAADRSSPHTQQPLALLPPPPRSAQRPPPPPPPQPPRAQAQPWRALQRPPVAPQPQTWLRPSRDPRTGTGPTPLSGAARYSAHERAHDRALRLEPSSGPAPLSSPRGPNPNKVFVGNLAHITTPRQLVEHCHQLVCCPVRSAKILRTADGRSKGCGLVTLECERDAAHAILRVDGTVLDGRRLYVKENRHTRGERDGSFDGR